jgi:hypothetical protein
MRIGYGWTATFFDGPKRVLCQKSGNPARRICYQYISGIRRLKRVDPKTGTALTDDFNRIPEDCLDELKRITRARWA